MCNSQQERAWEGSGGTFVQKLLLSIWRATKSQLSLSGHAHSHHCLRCNTVTRPAGMATVHRSHARLCYCTCHLSTYQSMPAKAHATTFSNPSDIVRPAQELSLSAAQLHCRMRYAHLDGNCINSVHELDAVGTAGHVKVGCHEHLSCRDCPHMQVMHAFHAFK